MEFLLQPNVYSTGNTPNLLNLLDKMWIKDHNSGEGTLYIISGFANYNGGVRFYPYFTDHIHKGGNVKVIIGGSTSQRLSSIQIAEAAEQMYMLLIESGLCTPNVMDIRLHLQRN